MTDILFDSAEDVKEFSGTLKTKRFGKIIRYCAETGSTNDRAKETAGEGCVEGTLIIAERQTRGRGRLDREWFSPPGGLWFSLVLKPEMDLLKLPGISMAVSIAIIETLNSEYGLPALFKWPNDVQLNGGKLAGILCETAISGSRIDAVVAGVGINVNNAVDDFEHGVAENPTSVKSGLGENVDRRELLKKLLESIERKYDGLCANGFSGIRAEIRQRCSLLGKMVSVETASDRMEGFASDIDEEGRLLLRDENGVVFPVEAGEAGALRQK